MPGTRGVIETMLGRTAQRLAPRQSSSCHPRMLLEGRPGGGGLQFHVQDLRHRSRVEQVALSCELAQPIPGWAAPRLNRMRHRHS